MSDRFDRLRSEFPDYPVDTLPAIPAHWEDASWHNDAAPFFIPSDNVGVFVDYPDEERRETVGLTRFSVCPMSERMHVADPAWAADTEDFSEVLAQCIAAEFVANLRELLSAEEFEEMRATNVNHTDDGVCASHDYCDSNMPMSDAFQTITGREVFDGAEDESEQHNADCALWNRAWEIAKARDLTAAAEGEKR